MNQGKLKVVKQEMARVNVDILGISELKWTGMGEFNSDDQYIYYCGEVPGENARSWEGLGEARPGRAASWPGLCAIAPGHRAGAPPLWKLTRRGFHTQLDEGPDKTIMLPTFKQIKEKVDIFKK